MTVQGDLFGAPPAGPEGFRLAPDLVGADDQAALVARFADLPFAAFEFHGRLGARRVAAFGRRYDFRLGRLEDAGPLPAFLQPLRALAAAFAGVDPETIAHTLVTEYAPGAGIGWHRDRPQYDKVIGVSFGAPCRLRFRRQANAGWTRRHADLAPGSAYLLDGPARWDWQHGITPLAALRYSVTFRTLRRP